MVQPKTLLIFFLFLSLLLFIETKHNHEEEEEVVNRSMFPDDFIFGVSTSAYQAYIFFISLLIYDIPYLASTVLTIYVVSISIINSHVDIS